MAARAIWKGIITFGMVSIPVKLYSATTSKSVSMHLVHKKCNSRIREQRYCPHCEKVVEYSELTKGYEYSKNEYVKLSDKDFEALPLPNKHAIEITDFVRLEEIDPIYYDKVYQLIPDEVAKKPYALFMKAVKDKNVLAIGKVALRAKERLCCLRPLNGALLLHTLLYPDEITADLEVEESTARVSEKELGMAEKLIELMTSEFEPDKYSDDYREALLQIIEGKVEGKEVEKAPEPERGGVIDLMAALEASMKNIQSGSKKRAETTKTRKTSSEKSKPEKSKSEKTKVEKKKSTTSTRRSRSSAKTGKSTLARKRKAG